MGSFPGWYGVPLAPPALCPQAVSAQRGALPKPHRPPWIGAARLGWEPPKAGAVLTPLGVPCCSRKALHTAGAQQRHVERRREGSREGGRDRGAEERAEGTHGGQTWTNMDASPPLCLVRIYGREPRGLFWGSPNSPWFVLGLDVPFPHLTAQNSETAAGWGDGAGVPGLARPGRLRAQTCSDTSLQSQLPLRQRPQQTPTRLQRFRFTKPPVTTLPLGPYRRSSPVPLGISVQETTPGHTYTQRKP